MFSWNFVNHKNTYLSSKYKRAMKAPLLRIFNNIQLALKTSLKRYWEKNTRFAFSTAFQQNRNLFVSLSASRYRILDRRSSKLVPFVLVEVMETKNKIQTPRSGCLYFKDKLSSILAVAAKNCCTHEHLLVFYSLTLLWILNSLLAVNERMKSQYCLESLLINYVNPAEAHCFVQSKLLKICMFTGKCASYFVEL